MFGYGWIVFAIIAGALVLVARLTKRPLEILAGRNVWIHEATRLAAKLSELRASATDVAVERDHWKAEAERLGHEMAKLSEKVSAMRAKGKRVVADRDRWEMQAKALADRLAEARGGYD